MTTFTTEDRLNASKPPQRPAVGSRWWSEDKKFLVLHTVDTDDGNVWVHYRDDNRSKSTVQECREYSCFLESFLQRFRELPDDQTNRLR